LQYFLDFLLILAARTGSGVVEGPLSEFLESAEAAPALRAVDL